MTSTRGGWSIATETLHVMTRGDSHIIDITTDVQAAIQRHGLREGQALVFVPGATAALTTIEYEPGLIEDLPAALERIAPRHGHYAHEEQWHDGNGYAHVRASLLGPSLTIPFEDGRLRLGTWQQIVLADFDNKPRRREVVIQLQGLEA